MGNKPSSEWPIALIGLDNAGKTAFVNCVVNGESTGTTPTIGIFEKKIFTCIFI